MVMGVSASSGAKLGVAKGRIEFATAGVSQARQRIQREAQEMGRAFDTAGARGKKGAETMARAWDKSVASIDKARNALGLFAAAATAAGVSSARRIARIETMFRALSSSEGEAAARLQEIKELAEDMNVPFQDMAEGAQTLLLSIDGTNASLKDTVTLASRLAVQDPLQGFEGAAFAIREFLSGSYTSLSARFEIPRKQLIAIRDSSADAAEMIQKLGEIVKISAEDVAKINEADPFPLLMSEGQMLLGEVFRPLLNEVILPIVRGLRDLISALRQMDPEITKLAGIVAGLAGTATVAGKALPLVGQLPGGKALGKAAGVAASGFIGAELGVRAVQAFSPAHQGKSLDEIRDELGMRIKQIIIILADAILTGAEQLTPAFTVLVDVLTWGAQVLYEAVQEIPNAIQGFLEDPLAGISYGIGTELLFPEDQKKGQGLFSNPLIESLSFGIGRELLFPSGGEQGQKAEQDQEVESTESRLQQLLRTGVDIEMSYQRGLDNAQLLSEQHNDLLGGLFDTLFPQTEAADAALNDTTGEIDKFSQGIQSMSEASRAAMQQIRPLIQQFNEETAKIQAQRGLSAARDLADFDRNRGYSISDFNKARARSDADYYRNRQKKVADFWKSIAQSETQAENQVQNLQAEYYKNREKAAEEHLDNLEKIEEDGRRAILEAASNLDAIAVQKAIDSRDQRIAAENESYEQQRAAEQIALQERIANIMTEVAEEKRARIAAFQEQLMLEDNQRKLQQQREMDDFQARLAREDKEREIRLQRLAEDQEIEDQYRQQALDKKIQAILKDNQLTEQWVSGAVNVMQGARNAIGNFLQSIANSASQMSSYIGGGYASNNQATVSTGATGTSHAQVFQTGGAVGRTGLAQVERGEFILREDVARAVRRMMGGNLSQSTLLGALGAGGTRQVNAQFGNLIFPETPTDPDAFYEMVEDVLPRAIGDFFKTL